MKTIVTGASGHVGANLVRKLLEQKRPVTCLVRSSDGALKGLPVEIVKGDVRDPASLAKAFAGASTVFHCAARIGITGGGWKTIKQINIDGVANVVEACLKNNVRRLVHFSSIHAFDPYPHGEPLNETRRKVSSPHAPPYDRSKAAGEQEVRRGIAQGLDAVILNPTGIIGPNDFHGSFLGRIVKQIGRGRMPIGVRGGFNWVDVRDVVDAALGAEAKGVRGEQYLVPGHWVSIGDMARVIDGMQGRKTMWLLSPLWLAAIGAPFAEWWCRLCAREPLYTSVSIATLKNGHKNISRDKASAAFGYCPRPFEETIRDTLAWYRENKLLD
ncbi:MAG TPA: NAD-dependent epimerase/dehydratase family protein [Chitinivibrionales bacterium]|nr:NAD-dependent epimerase/dehydratase family protein [Chitinivibrionales bacterium]